MQAASDSDTGALGGLINSIPGLDSILDNLTNTVGNGLDDIQGEILGSIASGLGLEQYYAFYTTKICQGNFTSDAPNAGVDISACYSYNEKTEGLLNITNSIPSSLVIGTAEVSVPLVETLQKTLQELSDLATGAATALMVFLIIAVVAQGLVTLGSREYYIHFSYPWETGGSRHIPSSQIPQPCRLCEIIINIYIYIIRCIHRTR